MVSWEFEKPSTWSLGKKIGFLAVILLFLGPFLPYWVRDYGSRTGHVAYVHYETFGLLGLIPIFSALLIVPLLYLKLNIYFEKDEERVNINHFILMIWGFFFIFIHIGDAIRVRTFSTAYVTYYPGIGLWMIIIGFLLCFAAGFLEWRHPSKVGPRVLFGRGKEKQATTNAIMNSSPKSLTINAKMTPSPKPVSSFESTKAISYKSIKEEETAKSEKVIHTASHINLHSEAADMEVVNREPRNEEEKTLIRWSRHISKDGKTYEQCIGCGKYVFINTEDKGERIVFKCPECGASFTLKK